MSDASLGIYVSDELGGRPGAEYDCAWRGGNSCKNRGVVLINLAEIDDGPGGVEYCRVHAEVMVGAAVTDMWKRFNASLAASLEVPQP